MSDRSCIRLSSHQHQPWCSATSTPSAQPGQPLVSLLHTGTSLLSTNQYVIVIALDFSEAFDIVRHHTLLEKMAQSNIPDSI